MDDQNYLYLKRKLLKLTKINLDDYKSQQMRRRLDTFIDHTGTKNAVDYGHMLEGNLNTLRELLNFLTINVSEFFRDLPMFDQLRTSILPRLLRNTKKLNIWSAGCSRGQESYSIAMMLESMSPPCHSYRILATDIDGGALQTAKAGGPYSRDDVKNLPPDLLERYFTGSGGEYRVINRIKEMVEFRQQNLLIDDFETGFDLIICRNVTIYFTEKAKRELNKRFYHSLKDGGVLFIGGTEVMLDAAKIGFEGLGVSFYLKPVLSTSGRAEVRENIFAQI